jgi:hypothetical protein
MVQVYLGFKGQESDSEPAPAHADAAGQGEGEAVDAGPVDADALQRFISNFQAAGGSVA